MSGLRRKPLTPKSPNVAAAAPPKSRSPVRRRPSPPSKQAGDPLQLQARLAASEMKRAQLERENALLRTDAEKKAATTATSRRARGGAARGRRRRGDGAGRRGRGGGRRSSAGGRVRELYHPPCRAAAPAARTLRRAR